VNNLPIALGAVTTDVLRLARSADLWMILSHCPPEHAGCSARSLRVRANPRGGSLRPVSGKAALVCAPVLFKEASVTVHSILSRKGATVFTIEPTASIAYAAKSLADHGIGALVVTGADGRTVGIISERDIVRALSARGTAVLETPVAEVMTRKVMSCSRQDKLVDLMQRMTEGKFRHFPVIEDGKLIGIVSIGDVVKSRLEQMEQESNALREYIRSA